MVINVFSFEKYYFKRGDDWNGVGDQIWYYAPETLYDLGLSGYRMGKSFLKSRIYKWISLLWTPEYNGDGSFQLELFDSPENRKIGLNDQLLYDEDKSGTIMVITSRQIRDKKIVLNGVSLHCYILSKIYSKSRITYEGAPEYAQDFLYNILFPFLSLNTLYLQSTSTAPFFPPQSGWDCVSAQSLKSSYAVLPSSLINGRFTWERGESAWAFIRDKILRVGDIGFGSYYIDSKDIYEGADAILSNMYGNLKKPSTFNYQEDSSKNGGWQGLYVRKPGINKSISFSKAKGNVSEEIYTESEVEYVNDITLFVGDNLEKLGFTFEAESTNPDRPYTIVPISLRFADEKQTPSVARRTFLLDASSEEPQGYNSETESYSETAEEYIKRMQSLADEHFATTRLTQNWKFTVIDSENKVNLGDIISIKSEYTGEVVESRVTSITYKSQGGHTTRTLSVGTPIKIRRN